MYVCVCVCCVCVYVFVSVSVIVFVSVYVSVSAVSVFVFLRIGPFQLGLTGTPAGQPLLIFFVRSTPITDIPNFPLHHSIKTNLIWGQPKGRPRCESFCQTRGFPLNWDTSSI